LTLLTPILTRNGKVINKVINNLASYQQKTIIVSKLKLLFFQNIKNKN